MLFRHVGLDCGVSVRALPVVCRYPVQPDPDFKRLRIVYDLGLPAYMLIWNTVEVIPVHLEVIGGVDGYFLCVLQEEGLWRQWEHILTFLPFVLFSAAVCPVLAGPVVEHVIQLIQPAVELVLRKEGVAADTAVIVSVCLVDKAFGRAFVPWPGRAAFVQLGPVVKAPLARGFIQGRLIAVCLPYPLAHVVCL